MYNQEKYHLREAAITTAAVGAGLAAYQTYEGAESKRKGQKALQDYNRQDLADSNVYEAIPISTVGSDIMREESQRTSANAVDALRNMGTRGAAYIPGIVAANNNANRESRSYLDDQVNRRNYAIAGDKSNIRSMQEERENADLAGIGQQIQTGRQDMWSGLRGLGSSAMYAMNNNDWAPKENELVEPIGGGLKPAGLVPYKTPKLPNYSNIYNNGF